MSPIEANSRPSDDDASAFRARCLTSKRNLHAVLISASQVLAIRLVGAALTYASMVCLARWLGSYNFGIYAYVLVIVTLLGLALSFGFNSSGVAVRPELSGAKEAPAAVRLPEAKLQDRLGSQRTRVHCSAQVWSSRFATSSSPTMSCPCSWDCCACRFGHC